VKQRWSANTTKFHTRSRRERKRGPNVHLIQNLQHVSIKALAILGQSAHLLRQAPVERLGHLLRLADAAALDDDVVEFLQLGEPDQLLEEVAAEGAADAAVLQGDDLLLGLCQAVGLLDQGCVDVDPAPVASVITNAMCGSWRGWMDGVGLELTRRCR
jgi:hypothetical protein